MQYPAIGQPDCVSIIVCDSVIEDKRTNKKSLIGLFSGIVAAQLPTQRTFFIVASLTNMVKVPPLKFKILSPSKEVAFMMDLQANPAAPEFAPSHVHDLVVEMRGFEFKEVGNYAVELWASDEPLIGSRTITVTQKG